MNALILGHTCMSECSNASISNQTFAQHIVLGGNTLNGMLFSSYNNYHKVTRLTFALDYLVCPHNSSSQAWSVGDDTASPLEVEEEARPDTSTCHVTISHLYSCHS